MAAPLSPRGRPRIAPCMSPFGRSLLRAALLAAGLVACGVAIRAIAPGLRTDGLGHAVVHRGLGGVCEFLALGTLVCAVGLPRQAVCFAGGFAFGVVAGTGLSLAATVIGCLIDFAWARVVGRAWLRRVLLARMPKLATLDRLLAERPFTTVLTLRLLPVGSSLMVSLGAGLSGAGTGAFVLASALGALPQSLVFALLGSGIGIGHLARVLVAIVLFLASAALGAGLMRKRDTALETATIE